ncbi:MAG: host attachment protein [Deltaproteobacteria bacterium]|nr:host attachment protein [Deltaproteobacteria bacterium]
MLTWILIAQRAGARIFASRGPRAPLQLVRQFDHPIGRLHDRDLESDKPGRLFKPSRSGNSRFATDSERTTHDNLAGDFARELAECLALGRGQNQYDALILVAEPRFLGLLHSVIDAKTRKKIIGSLGKDLSAVSEAELPQHLRAVLEDWSEAMLTM